MTNLDQEEVYEEDGIKEWIRAVRRREMTTDGNAQIQVYRLESPSRSLFNSLRRIF